VTGAGSPIAVGIVGFGKIARDHHVGAIRGSARFSLHCVADPNVSPTPVPRYPSVERLLEAEDAPAAIAICTPPQARYRAARLALAQGKHVLLEKPPTVTLAELEDLRGLAAQAGATLFCAWHSRFAPAVAPACEWLATRTARRVRIDWREDVRVWHPGQRWIWEPGGFGVFDPGINALSVVTKLLPERVVFRDALLRIPDNCAMPIAAELTLSAGATEVTASLDFLQPEPATWEIAIETDNGSLLLSQGGRRLVLAGREVPLGPRGEYPALYAHFATLIERGRSDVDAYPLELVSEALQHGRREDAPAFVDPSG
jgi:D-galactose 1-dehydrogenase